MAWDRFKLWLGSQIADKDGSKVFWRVIRVGEIPLEAVLDMDGPLLDVDIDIHDILNAVLWSIFLPFTKTTT